MRVKEENAKLRDLLRFALDSRHKYLCNNPKCPGCPSWHHKLAEARAALGPEQSQQTGESNG